MYQLRVSLILEGSHRIDGGVAVVGAPEVFASNPTAEDLAASGETGECFRSLVTEYRRVQEWQGVRPARVFSHPSLRPQTLTTLRRPGVAGEN